MPVLADDICCTGCGVCADACPRNAIDIVEDHEGFYRPRIDISKCISCGMCERTCPEIAISGTRNYYVNNIEPCAYCAVQLVNHDDLCQVSSGGAFWALAQTIIESKGIVYGAVARNVDQVFHKRAKSLDEAGMMRLSKYLPSFTRGIYRCIRDDLTAGKLVLFSGLPCQCAGLKAFLGRPPNNLIICDLVCHGTPSLLAFRKWREEYETSAGKRFESFAFRDKSCGWEAMHYRIAFTDGSSVSERKPQSFKGAYTSNLFLRPSCGKCRYANLHRVSDITLADYWTYRGVTFESSRSLGVSLVLLNTSRGKALFGKAVDAGLLIVESTKKDNALESCPQLQRAPEENPRRKQFFRDLRKYGFSVALVRNLKPHKQSMLGRIIRLANRIKGRMRKLLEMLNNRRCSHDT